jgi:porin
MKTALSVCACLVLEHLPTRHWLKPARRVVDGGFNFTGFVPGRDNDVAGLAFAHSDVSSNYSDSQVLQGNAPYTAESFIETTYKVQIAPWWSIQLDVQYYFTPIGQQGSHNAVVLGLSTNVAF